MLVAIDLETTGLNPDYDRIIEIGAVKFDSEGLVDTWQTLINPGMSIPDKISLLTGIHDADVEEAPRLSYKLPELQQFIGSLPLVGHNINFDVSFLRNSGLPMRNKIIDTYAVAATLIPNSPGYSLSALIQLLNLPTGDAHRALDDAVMTAHLHGVLRQRAWQLPLETLEDIAQASETIEWGGRLFFMTIYEERIKSGQTGPRQAARYRFEEAVLLVEEEETLEPSDELIRVPVEDVAALIEPEGKLALAHERYEYREEQVHLLKRIATALNEGNHTMIEAPTGVGKSLAYLIPAAHFALANEQRVLISTNTINLQEQLIKKDIPFLQAHLDKPFRAAVLKGRSNYLCPRRLEALRRRGPTSALEMLVYAKTLVWLTQSRTGDRGEINLRGPVENGLWSRLSAENEGCTLGRCMVQMGGACPFYQARRAAESAHLIVVNHALLLSDAAAEGHILPDYRYLIVDEAHHLEDAVTNSMRFRVGPDWVKRQLADLGTEDTGLLGDLLGSCEDAIPKRHYESLKEFVGAVANASALMESHVEGYFTAVQTFLKRVANIRQGTYSQPVRITEQMREMGAWSAVSRRWDNLSKYTSTIAEGMGKLSQAFAELDDYGIEGLEDLVRGLSASARHMQELHIRLHELTTKPDENFIYWADFPADGGPISLNAAPLNIGSMVETHLWGQRESVIMLSATLRTAGSFKFMRDRLAAHDVEEVVIGSPFDYRSNTLLYIADDIPEPRDRDAFQEAVEITVRDLCLATEGRALVLFTSYAQLRQTSEAISGPLLRAGILVFDQSDGASRTQLLDGFVQTERSVLMGTRSFWEGVDVPGDDLSVLVIVRLPFSVPTDPIYASRSEQYPNPFVDYGVQETILRFRQGFGRLIRTSADRGVVVILDRRVISKRYGRMFLESLPETTTRRGPMAMLPSAAAEWLSE